MRRWVALAWVAAVVLAMPAAPVAQTADSPSVEHGRYLAAIGGCVACHTASGGAPWAGGKPAPSPFGTVFSANLTPDAETGIGAWTEAQFIRAMQDGLGQGREHLYPAFPYRYFTTVRQDDLRDILAFLRTIAPVRRPVDRSGPWIPRAAIFAWNAGNFRPGEYRPDPTKDATWNRGGYLVEGLGHCGACHSPKNLVGGDDRAYRYTGGRVDGWYAPDISGQARTGLGGWTVDEVVGYLRQGWSGTAAAWGPMAQVVAGSTSHMDEVDLRAMAIFLRDQPGRPDPAPALLPSSLPTMRDGAALYAGRCGACHTAQGGGVAGVAPALADAPGVQQADATTLIRSVLHGGRALPTAEHPDGPVMPGYAATLDDGQVAAVLNHVRNSWGNAAPEVTAGDVRRVRVLIDAARD